MSASAALPRWAQAGLIVAAGAAAAAALWLTQPRRGDLGPVDFTAGGPDALEFCDAAHPRFIAVTDRLSPVVLKQLGPQDFALRTATGKPVGPRDVLGGTVRMYGVDDGISRFAAGEATFAGNADWRWAAPAGITRVFADFTPVVTGQEMYASARVENSSALRATRSTHGISLVAPATCPAGQEIEVKVILSAPAGAPELAAFDLGRDGPTGFVVRRPDRLGGGAATFRLTFTDPGQYVLWGSDGANQTRARLTVTP